MTQRVMTDILEARNPATGEKIGEVPVCEDPASAVAAARAAQPAWGATPVRDRAKALLQVRERLIERQDTHLDSLAERLREERVVRVIRPILAGTTLDDVPLDDIRFVLDLGLCRYDQGGGLVIANPIYREVIPRVLAATPQASLTMVRPTWLNDDGSLNPQLLLAAFLAFWRQHGQPCCGPRPGSTRRSRRIWC